jgi:hypothetical protein
MKTPILESLIVVLIVCLGWLQTARAVSPPPDGAYPNFTTAEGQNALKDLTTGSANTALGAYSMFSTTTASFNTAVGAGALDLNTGDNNTAVGVASLLLNTGTNNTGVGVDALGLNTTGESNAAVGAFALYNNTTGGSNTAVGYNALSNNTTTTGNTAVGTAAGINITGAENTAVGFLDTGVGPGITSGSANVVLGTNAGAAIEAGIFNVCIGSGTGSIANIGNENVYIGASENAPGPGVENNTIRIADNSSAAPALQCFIGGIRGVTTQNNDAIPVLIDSNFQLGTVSSSARFKTDIKPIDKTSECLLALRPVSFRYKVHKDRTPQFGLIAEQVAEVNPDLVIYDADGKPYTVRYEAVNAMLLNEFLKEHQTVQELKKQVAELTAGLQKVSAQLELSKAAPQTVQSGRP